VKEKCFANRKDGQCHALSKKECDGCKFYYPRKLIKDNPFYEYSYVNEAKMKYIKKLKLIRDENVMKIND
jgi:hypothetical protein